MTVKTIFKILLASMVLPVLSFLVIEFYNVSSVSGEIGRLTNTAAYQAAVLFNQESYKVGAGAGSYNGLGNQKSVVDEFGEVYISGKFYSGETPYDVYKNIYRSRDFREWISHEVHQVWRNIYLVDLYLNWTWYDDEDGREGRFLAESLMTPSNMGVPYLNKDIVSKMFRWNLAELFSGGKPQNIKKDRQGRMYSSYNGYRVYAQDASITNLEYRVYDLLTTSGRSGFMAATNVDPSDRIVGMGADDERRYVAVVGIEYSVPMSYEGITPIKRAFEFVWNTEVEGLNGKSQRDVNTTQVWSEAVADFESGGFSGNTALEGVLPLPGKLIYFILR